MHQAEKGIRFITSDYTALFRLPDGGKIRILRQDGTHIDRVCSWIRWRILPEIHAAAQRIEVMRDDRAEIPDLEQLLVGLRGLA